MTVALRVTFVVDTYPPSSGGVQRHVEALAARLARRGHRVDVVCLAERGTRARVETRAGVRVHRLPALASVAGIAGIPGPSAWRRVVREVVAGCDVVSVHTRFFPMTVLGLRAAGRLGIPTVLTEHGSGHVVTGSPLVDRCARLVDWTAGRWAWRSATEVLAVSDEVAAFVRAQTGRGATVFGNGVDTARWRRARPARPHLVFVGRLVPEKGWSTFLDIAADVLRRDPAATASLLGDGPDLPVVRARVDQLGLRDRISAPGLVSSEEVADQLAGGILVNPTMASEGYQLTLPEAVAAGARVVTYSVGGVARLAALQAPVQVVRRGDVAALRQAVAAELQKPSAPADPETVAALDWEALAGDFEARVRSMTGRHQAVAP